jgi:nuclear respiratory factor 1
MKELSDEFAGRCGQQICIVCCSPTKTSKCTYKVFGTKPLEDVLRNQKSSILIELDNLLESKSIINEEQRETNQASNKFDLPSLTIDGIPTTLDKMTQVM